MENINNLIDKIYNMDCLDFMKSMPEKSIDLILCDPPYGINYLSNWTNNHAKIKNDGLEDWQDLMKKFLPEARRILTDTGCCCCCGGGKTPVTALFTIEAIKHFYLIQMLVWKKFIGLGWRYRPAYENIVVLSKSKDDYNFFDTSKSCSNVLEGINQDIPNSEEHPTQKPVSLMERLIKIHSQKGMIVFDPFLGSGTTAVACIELGRHYIGCELDKGYFRLSEERIAKAKSRPQFEFEGD